MDTVLSTSRPAFLRHCRKPAGLDPDVPGGRAEGAGHFVDAVLSTSRPAFLRHCRKPAGLDPDVPDGRAEGAGHFVDAVLSWRVVVIR